MTAALTAGQFAAACGCQPSNPCWPECCEAARQALADPTPEDLDEIAHATAWAATRE
jgi:hypothetical protein